ncbi:MAG TPA: GAF domain-containing protein [Anaerolineae bacterium]|nr:GAF domain-containing protein [Anaerolineae bacterium]
MKGAIGNRFGLDTIRSRLLVAFVVMTLLSVVAVTLGAVVLARQSAQQRVLSQLESVATLKEAEINAWVAYLQDGLKVMLIGEQVVQPARLLVQESPDSAATQEARDQLRGYFQRWIAETQQFDELFLLDSEGRVVLSTDPVAESKIYSNRTFFQQGLKGAYVQPPLYSASLDKVSVIVAQPVVDFQGEPLGVLAGRASMAPLHNIMQERAGLGETGETYLVGLNHALLTPLRSGEQDIYVRTEGANVALEEQTNGSGVYANPNGDPVLGVYRWLPELQVALLAEQERSEALLPLRQILLVNMGMAAAVLFLAVIAALFITRGIADPVAELAETAERIAAGDLGLVVRAERRDEIGVLARAFNSMTARLRGLIDTLEQRVADRTRDLAQRSAYLEASAEVARAASSILEVDELIRQTVELIRERFGLYYVGLFEIDAQGEWAVLRAGTGEAGRTMLARGHRLKIGEHSMIGWSIAHAQARVAQVTEEDAVHLATPELPDTRSEAALPLRARGQVIGALTVQSDKSDAFDEATITVLQTMADQVALAISNARLFEQAQASIEAERRAYGELSRQAWVQIIQRSDKTVYHSRNGVVSALKPQEVPDADNLPTLNVPVRVHGQTVAVIQARKPDVAGEWRSDEAVLVETLAGQLGVALESARLYQETQRRAAREQLIGEITTRVRESLEIETVLRTAAEEIRRALGLERAVVRLVAANDGGQNGKGDETNVDLD